MNMGTRFFEKLRVLSCKRMLWIAKLFVVISHVPNDS